jgi:phycocyanin-associated rod protein
MFGQTTLGASSVSSSASRVFRYEVVGLTQNQETDKINSTFAAVVAYLLPSPISG